MPTSNIIVATATASSTAKAVTATASSTAVAATSTVSSTAVAVASAIDFILTRYSWGKVFISPSKLLA